MEDKIIGYCRFCQEGEDPKKRVVIRTDKGYECGLGECNKDCTILNLYRREDAAMRRAMQTPTHLARYR